MTSINLSKLQVSFLADISRSMENESRFQQMSEVGFMLAKDLVEIDDTGLLQFITFGRRVYDHDEVNYDKLKSILVPKLICGTTPLAKALSLSWTHCKKRLNGFESAHNLIVVVTSGEPDDQKEVVQVIQNIANDLTSNSQCAILFIQVGNDKKAKKFLQFIDDDISKVTNNLDIVDTCHYSELANYSIQDLIVKAFDD